VSPLYILRLRSANLELAKNAKEEGAFATSNGAANADELATGDTQMYVLQRRAAIFLLKSLHRIARHFVLGSINGVLCRV
jgi:hypothetical protein